jgi:hypothetical protein
MQSMQPMQAAWVFAWLPGTSPAHTSKIPQKVSPPTHLPAYPHAWIEKQVLEAPDTSTACHLSERKRAFGVCEGEQQQL